MHQIIGARNLVVNYNYFSKQHPRSWVPIRKAGKFTHSGVENSNLGLTNRQFRTGEAGGVGDVSTGGGLQRRTLAAQKDVFCRLNVFASPRMVNESRASVVC